jgi:transcriptional regulator with XRE-family HTH domain
MPTVRKTNQAIRLQTLRELRGLTMREVADYIGKSSSRVSDYEANPAIRIKKPVLEKLATLYRVTPGYIQYGEEGPPPTVVDVSSYVSEEVASYEIKSNARRISLDEIPFRVIPYLPIRARAGFAESFADDSYKYEREETLAVPGVPDTKEFEESLIIEVDGDSMDSGENSTLRSGARVLVTPVQQADWQYMSSGVYCFVFRSTFVIKRVKDNTLLSKGMITLHSDNPNGGSLDVLGEDIRAVWKVRWGVFTPIN